MPIAGIKFLYNEIREYADPKLNYPFKIISRTFDALDNSLKNLYNAQQVVASNQNSFRATFFFSSLTASLSSSHINIPDGINDYAPQSIIVNGTAPTANALFDVQTSPDDVVWTSILQSPLILPAAKIFSSPVKVFSGTKLLRKHWLRALVLPTSDLTATNVNIELDIINA